MRQWLPVFLLATGCYKAIGLGEVPTSTAPPHVEGNEQVVATDQSIKLDRYYVAANGDVVQRHKRVGEASYAGKTLTMPELRQLADQSEWDRTVAHAKELRDGCRRGEIPEYVAGGALIAMTALGLITVLTHNNDSENLSHNETLMVEGAYGAAGVAVASYIVGYAIGGRHCDEYTKFATDNYIGNTDTTFVSDEVDLINKLAVEFNAKHEGSPAEADATPSEP
ncbi:MAG TPA: hypothetical protein VGC41_09110 [Kofleriaceae bacterium]